MKLTRVSYRTAEGSKARAPKWYVRFRDHRGVDRRIPAFTDKGASEEFGRKIARLVSHRIACEQLGPELTRFVAGLPSPTLAALSRWGVVEDRTLHANRSLSEHLKDYQDHLTAKGDSSTHIRKTVRNITRVLVIGCGFTHWSSVEPEAVERHLHGLREHRTRGVSRRTSNELLGSCRQFSRWMERTGRLPNDPLRRLSSMNVRTDLRRRRRALTIAEQRNLIQATAAEPFRHGLTGIQRAWVYRLALETALRAAEIRSLKVASFEGLGTDSPSVRVAAAYSKRRREDVLPLRAGTASEIQAWLDGRSPEELAFPLPAAWRSAEMLREDLYSADIPPIASDGSVVDFHALRHTAITTFVGTNAAPKVAQTFARHSTITLTLDRYTHLGRDDERAAVAKMPDLGVTASPQTPPAPPSTPSRGASHLPLHLPELAAARCSEVQPAAAVPLPGAQERGLGGPCRTRTCDQAIMSRLL